jgi:hypothetical protein
MGDCERGLNIRRWFRALAANFLPDNDRTLEVKP